MKRGAKFKDLLRGSVPSEIIDKIPRSFYIVGDIALVALDEDVARAYGREIARAIMELHPSVRAVFARGARYGVERVPKLIHLGGEYRTTTVHKEYGVRIVVDIEKAYFNPALGEEHHRVAQSIRDGDAVADLFTGVGPFALHAAKIRYCYVLAADINAVALELLRKSISLNKLKGCIDPVHMDSIAALRSESLRGYFDVVIMNLPHEAHRYAAAALRIVKRGGVVHVYTIATREDEAVHLVVSQLGSSARYRVLEVRRVLDYAPRKYVFRVSIAKA